MGGWPTREDKTGLCRGTYMVDASLVSLHIGSEKPWQLHPGLFSFASLAMCRLNHIRAIALKKFSRRLALASSIWSISFAICRMVMKISAVPAFSLETDGTRWSKNNLIILEVV